MNNEVLQSLSLSKGVTRTSIASMQVPKIRFEKYGWLPPLEIGPAANFSGERK